MPPIPVALSGYTHDTFFFVAPDTFLSNFRKSVRLTCACRWLLDCFLKVGVTGAFFSLYGKMPFLKEILKYQKKRRINILLGTSLTSSGDTSLYPKLLFILRLVNSSSSSKLLRLIVLWQAPP